MIRITDKRGYTYYMSEANLPDTYQRHKSLFVAAVNYIARMARDDATGWLQCYRDMLLRDKVAIAASEIYVIEEVRDK